jgi:endonuclease G, mitochondrial
MVISQSQWRVSQAAAAEYEKFATEIEKVRKDIQLLNQGLKHLTDISHDKDRVHKRVAREMNAPPASVSASPALFERVLGRADFQDVYILQRLVNYARCVGKVILPDGSGTGWLVGDGLLITNHHVIPNRKVGSKSCVVFEYERMPDKTPQTGEIFSLRPDLFFMTPKETEAISSEDLDFTIIGVDTVSKSGKNLSAYGHITLDEGLGKAIEGENCVIIQHPEGDFKKVVLRDTRLLKVGDVPGAENHLYYESDTLPGSSGAVVVALGTGEVIALHNAGVPRMDARGNFLKKNGDIYRQGDDDADIDWVANQGVRVSKLVAAIRSLALPPEMEDKRQSLLNNSLPQPAVNVNLPLVNPVPAKQPSEPRQVEQPKSGGTFISFIIRVVNNALIKKFVQASIAQVFPGSKISPVSEEGNYGPMGAYLEVAIPQAGDPWQMAAALENIDGIEQADPDLPQYATPETDEFKTQTPYDLTGLRLREGALFDSGKSKWNESRFLKEWRDSIHIKELLNGGGNRLPQIRKWNHLASGFEAYFHRISSRADSNSEYQTLLKNLPLLRMAQFDTGYSLHSKVKDGYNLLDDYDALDEDNDALDSESRGFLKFPGHGTRTGSIVMGIEDSLHGVREHEGNYGLLAQFIRPDKTPAIRLTPFRIAKSVILLGRVSQLVKSVHVAVNNGYDVLTMSMGTLGNPVLEQIARFTYEKGVIWCSAAGNQVKFVVAPARYPGVIAVAACNPDDAPWPGSCCGPEVDITAPGEDVYVPIINQDDEEDMAYGSGTSYATPHVASAAMLWLAKNKQEIEQLYTQPWQRVEAFRYCLQVSARTSRSLPHGKFGAGILNIDGLLKVALPAPAALRHAYTNQPGSDTAVPVAIRPAESFASTKTPLALRELQYKDWLNVVGNVGSAQTSTQSAFTESFVKENTQLSAGAKAFGNLLANENKSIKAGVSARESITGTGPLASYTRLTEINKLNSVAKPLYQPAEKADTKSATIAPDEQTDISAGNSNGLVNENLAKESSNA